MMICIILQMKSSSHSVGIGAAHLHLYTEFEIQFPIDTFYHSFFVSLECRFELSSR